MAAENRRAWLDKLAIAEGGYVNHPNDPGGPTNRGVTQATLAEWRGRPVTVDDVKALTIEEAEAIASAKYWNQVKGDQLPGGVDVYAADFAYNSGPRGAIKVCQRALGFDGSDVDGYVGPLTLNAIRQYQPAELIEGMHAARMAFLEGLPTWGTFGKGWTKRCLDMRDLALSLAPDEAPAVAVAQKKAKTTIIATVASVATGAVTAGPLIVEALPGAKIAFDQTRQALGPLAELAPWMQYIVMAVSVCTAASAVYLAVKNHKLQDKAA